MTEEELLQGVLDAALVGGWLVHHDRRSDLALQQGTAGFPDIIAVHPQRALVFVAELKARGGRLGPYQVEWLAAFTSAGVDTHVVTPDQYDATVEHLLGDRLVKRRRWTDHPENDG